MICNSCGKENGDNNAFCNFCGKRVVGDFSSFPAQNTVPAKNTNAFPLQNNIAVPMQNTNVSPVKNDNDVALQYVNVPPEQNVAPPVQNFDPEQYGNYPYNMYNQKPKNTVGFDFLALILMVVTSFVLVIAAALLFVGYFVSNPSSSDHVLNFVCTLLATILAAGALVMGIISMVKTFNGISSASAGKKFAALYVCLQTACALAIMLITFFLYGMVKFF